MSVLIGAALCGIVSLFTVAHASVADASSIFASIKPEFCNTVFIKCINVMNLAPEEDAHLSIHNSCVSIYCNNRISGSGRADLSMRRDDDTAQSSDLRLRSLFGHRIPVSSIRVEDRDSIPLIKRIGWRLAVVHDGESHLRLIINPKLNLNFPYRDICSELAFGGVLGETRLFGCGYGGISSGESGNSGKDQRGHDQRQPDAADNQLSKSVIGGLLGGGRHTLLFAQVGFAVIVGIAAWGPIFWGIRLLAFGGPIIPSDFILMPRVLIRGRYPRLIGFFSLCCGLLIFTGGAWLTWFLGE